MNWFHSKYRALAEQLAVELDSTKQELNLERAKRISAEAVSEERRLRCEHAEASAQRAEASRDEAISKRLAGVDLVNTALLGAIAPEKQVADVKSFSPVMKTKQQSIPIHRKLERMFIQQSIRKQNGNKAAPPTKEESATILEAQMDALGFDSFFQ